MKESLIYILTNPSFPNYVKIGKTTDLKQRIRDLNSPSCLPFSFRAYAIYKIDKNLDTAEKAIHNLIDMIDYDLRAREEVDSGRTREREFFALDAENAFEVLRQVSILRGDEENLSLVKPTTQQKLEEQTAKKVEERAERSRPLSFPEYGIPIGSELSFTHDPTVVVKVVDDRKIEYKGKKYTLSGLATTLMRERNKWKETTTAQGPLYFEYNGKLLTEIRKEIEH